MERLISYFINQNCNKIFERDWISQAQFEHLKDSVRVMLVIGQCTRTVNTCVHIQLYVDRTRHVRALLGLVHTSDGTDGSGVGIGRKF